MDFHDEKFLEILKSNTVTRENNGLFVDLILDDDRNYHNDELLLCMGDHSKIKKIAGKNGKDSEYALKIVKYFF